ncbi:hypothetical protein DENIS_4325 [Desulfonema ishimotonii]|uniref:Uncharacterized protein n=1 Tax=Desulfonema ishimotonii TaxID=45657 RepID=A0A401G2E2_9BACT|nr:hypothetical protein [Desulfonema ishimotonii]GBC63331.1 hypothetical protein DENIS_4325 [Desulfonema ishimotonii]
MVTSPARENRREPLTSGICQSGSAELLRADMPHDRKLRGSRIMLWKRIQKYGIDLRTDLGDIK